jgi:hypothetical protein
MQHVSESAGEPIVTQYSETPYEIFTIDGLYEDAKIEEWLRYVLTNDMKTPFNTSTYDDFKNGKIMHPEYSSYMYDRMKSCLPEMYTDEKKKTWRFERAPKYIMCARTHEGASFAIHTDTGCEYDKAAKLLSKFTVLTYLNDDFEGGDTIFYDDMFRETCRVKPKRGRTLIFDIDVYHAGAVVQKGCKCWIGTELVCIKTA